MKKHVIAGLGEIGIPILRLISKAVPAIGHDIKKKLVNQTKIKKYNNLETSCLHICIPFNRNFIKNVISLNKKFQPELIVIHSTVSPFTTKKLQKKLSIPIIYSPIRGVHKRMIKDLKRYTKFYALQSDAPDLKNSVKLFSNVMKKCNIQTKQMSSPLTLELAKIIVDTSYYGWLITYAQLSNLIAIKNKVNYDEMWSYADEIHKYLNNRPKMIPGFIGGHCVIPNLDLINNPIFDLIREQNKKYLKKNYLKKKHKPK